MNSNISDNKLELYISKIKTGTNSNNKVLNYKRATERLKELKTEYNKLCNVLKNKDTDELDSDDINSDDINSDDKHNKKKSIKKSSLNDDDNPKINIAKIISELNKINTELDNGSNNMQELVDKYVQYKLLLNDLELESETIKNQIHKVEENKNKIIIHKLDLTQLCA